MKGMMIGMAAFATVAVAAGFLKQGRPNLVSGSSFGAPAISSIKVGTDPGAIKEGGPLHPAKGDELACFSGGCFWGVEEHYRKIPGVVSTAVGFTGGNVPNPSYELVCTHTTGHTESVLVEFDPKKVTYRQLVDSLWTVADPTQVNRQGPDIGDNYRSAVWTFNDAQKADALASIKARQSKESGPIVTRVLTAQPFYMAEDYHQQYDEKTGTDSCPVRE